MNFSLNLSQGWIFPKCFKTLSFSLTMTQTNFQTDGDSTHFHTDSKMIFLYNNQRKKSNISCSPVWVVHVLCFHHMTHNNYSALKCSKCLVQTEYSSSSENLTVGTWTLHFSRLLTVSQQLVTADTRVILRYLIYANHVLTNTQYSSSMLNTISCRWDNCSANFIPVCVTLRRATDGSLSHVWQYSWLLRVYRGHGLINLTFITKKTFRSYFLMVLLIS